jgi:hypothetical protein
MISSAIPGINLKLKNYQSADGSLCPRSIAEIARLNRAEAFIETGAYMGDTVGAMREIFSSVYSIELSEKLHRQAVKRFEGDTQVKLLLGDSIDMLGEVGAVAGNLRSVFWLDAHWSAGDTSRGLDNTPIKQELMIIAKQNFADDIIMIDDLRYFGSIPAGFDVHESNNGYPLLYEMIEYIHEIMPAHASICVGDILLVVPLHIFAKIEISSVLRATNKLRFKSEVDETTPLYEHTISSAEGVERETLLMLPERLKPSLRYGIGGSYLYWRGLVYENDTLWDEALADFTLARRCGISVPTRFWE